MDVEFPLNKWDFVGNAYVTSLKEANRINMEMAGEVSEESLKEYFRIVNEQWIINVPDQDQFKTENNVDEFEMQILSRYSAVMSAINTPTASIIISKVFEGFVIRNVANEQSQQRLLVYMSLQRHSSAFFYSEGIIVNGTQIFSDDIGPSGINSDIVNDVIDCMYGYAADWTSLEWLGWGLAAALCNNAILADCVQQSI